MDKNPSYYRRKNGFGRVTIRTPYSMNSHDPLINQFRVPVKEEGNPRFNYIMLCKWDFGSITIPGQVHYRGIIFRFKKIIYGNDFWDKSIDKNTDWGGDASTQWAPVSGSKVQEFIKSTLQKKVGEIYYQASQARYLVFADSEDRELYLSDPEANNHLLISYFGCW